MADDNKGLGDFVDDILEDVGLVEESGGQGQKGGQASSDQSQQTSDQGQKGGQSSSQGKGWHGDHSGHVKAGKQAAKTAEERYGKDFHEEVGAKGGRATAASHDESFYEEIGHEGGMKSPTKFKKGSQKARVAGRKGGRS